MAGLTKGMLARSVHDAAWSLLVQLVQFKAESAGADVVMVDPRGTSQTCPACGTIKAKTLSARVHACDCGCVLDRDVAAARIVHQQGLRLGPRYWPSALKPADCRIAAPRSRLLQLAELSQEYGGAATGRAARRSWSPVPFRLGDAGEATVGNASQGGPIHGAAPEV